MNNLAHKPLRDDHRVQIAKTRIQQLRPPYAPELPVTRQSVFRDNSWHYSASELPAGHKGGGYISFTRPVKIANQRVYSINPIEDETLLEQLKEATFCFIFFRDALPSRRVFVKPLGAVAQANLLIILFANIAAAGFRSLADLSPSNVQEIFSNLPNTSVAHNMMIDTFRDLLILAKKKLLSVEFRFSSFVVPERTVVADVSKSRSAGGYTEEQLTFLLSASKVYIEKRIEVACYLRKFRQKQITRRRLIEWANENLDLRKPLGRKHGHKQLAWFVRIAVYNFIAFALSSRCSEVLSAEANFLGTQQESEMINRVIIELTVAKGSYSGRKQQYIVHPYLALVADTIQRLNDALQETGPYAFMKNNGKYISVNNINHALKEFAVFHHGGPSGRYTTHKWRYTMPDLLIMTVKHPLPIIQERLGHEYIGESIAYAFGGPSGKQLQEVALSVAGSAAEGFVSLLENEERLGGREGMRLSQVKATGVETKKLVEDLVASGTVPLEVEPGKYCLKQSDYVGECGVSRGDTLPNTERCRSTCLYQAQNESYYWDLKATIEDLPHTLPSLASMMEMVRHAQLIKEALTAWPTLSSELEQVLEKHQKLRIWFK